MKRWGKQKPVRFDEKELKTDLGEGNFIFVGSSCDMWANAIPEEWILKTIDHIDKYPYNKYLFQSKNPKRMFKERWMFRPTPNYIFGTTIETNRFYPQMGKAPEPFNRALNIAHMSNKYFRTMVTIEPIMDFDLKDLIFLVTMCNPEWVNIGANTNHKVKLCEPEPEKLQELIFELKKITKVKIKKNLNRLRNSVK